LLRITEGEQRVRPAPLQIRAQVRRETGLLENGIESTQRVLAMARVGSLLDVDIPRANLWMMG
jgi:hypothetical protein